MVRCLCGNEYTPVPDDEVEGLPPIFTARQFKCATCGALDWVTPEDLGFESWDEVENEAV